MNQNDTETSQLSIADFTQDYNECKGCEKGIKYCKRPCWPTPQEVRNLMNAGYGDRLMLDMWGRTVSGGGHIFIIAPATPGCEGTYSPDGEFLSLDEEEFNELAAREPMKVMAFMMKEMKGMLTGDMSLLQGCNFQSEEGLCELHNLGLKPFEGKKSCCKVKDSGIGLHSAVAQSWDSEEGREVVKEWKEKHFKS